jgi:NADPH:quinone reductase-like Zn-dependent oxidoreductase
LLVIKGDYNPRQPLPLIPMSDGVGEVVETGEGVDRVEVGNRVAGIFAQEWLDGPLDLEARASIVTSSSNEKLEKVESLGVDDTINYRDTPDWDREVRRMTGAGVDHIVEVGGAGTLPKSLNSVKLGGSVYVIGVLSGVAAEIQLTSIMMKQVRVQGILVGSRRTFESMNRFVEEHGLRPVVDRVYPFDRAPDAFNRLAAGGHFGKLVIRVG